MSIDKLGDVFERRFDPDFTVRPPYIRESGFALGLNKVHYCGWPELPLPENSSRMVNTNALKISNSMSREKSSPTNFSNAGMAR